MRTSPAEPTLFVDVDGVLLHGDGRLAPHVVRFLTFATSRFACRWLTTHVREQCTDAVMQHVLRGTPSALRADVRRLAERIEPAGWPKWKTDALPEHGRFVWLDDAPTATELMFLRERGWLDRWVHVDVDEDADDLVRAERLLRSWLDTNG